MDTIVLAAAEVVDLLDHPSLVAALSAAHARLARGAATQPVSAGLASGEGRAAERPAVVPMTALDRELDVSVVKLLADAPVNRAAGLPAQRSTVALFDNATAACLALVDGRELTRLRTAAVSAMATAALATDQAALGVVGAGALAVEHVIAHARTVKTKQVVAWTRSETTRETFSRAVGDALGGAVEVRFVPEPRAVFEACATVCTITPSETAYVEGAWLRRGHHINAVGSPPRPSHSEMSPDAMLGADLVVVDSRAVASAESGNIRRAAAAGLDTGALTEIGEVLAGQHVGRDADQDVTIFNSVGIGLQDLAAAKLLLDRALAQGRGQRIRLRD